jgi:HSP20 family molecular chaperone IbpA
MYFLMDFTMDTNWLKARWVQRIGFALILLVVAILASAITYWFIRPQRIASHSFHGIGRMNDPDWNHLRASLEQLHQLQSGMDPLLASDFEASEATKSVNPQHPEQMLAQMEQLFRQMGMPNPPVDPAGTFDEGWNVLAISPSINMRPEKDRLILTVTLPQTEKKDIHLTLNGDILKISAERQAQTTTDDPQARISRHAHSRFEQQIRLPATPTLSAEIEATFEDNVLQVIIPLPGLNPPHETQVPIR